MSEISALTPPPSYPAGYNMFRESLILDYRQADPRGIPAPESFRILRPGPAADQRDARQPGLLALGLVFSASVWGLLGYMLSGAL